MSHVDCGKQVLRLEAASLLSASERLGQAFDDAVDMVLKTKGKIVVTGLGKSGHIGAKIASTLSSTGSQAMFLNSSEALHGDFGLIDKSDVLLALAFGGETREVLAVVRFAKSLSLNVIAITGSPSSSLARAADVVLDGQIEKEADTLGLAPTSSSTLALALGDALAVALMRAKDFSRDNFAALHPGGSLGRSLSKVADWMRPLAELPFVGLNDNFHVVLNAVTAHNFGIAAVRDKAGALLGVISDGDLRRALFQKGGMALELGAGHLMNKAPKTIEDTALVVDAVAMLEANHITSLFVTSKREGGLVGLVRLHDLLAGKQL